MSPRHTLVSILAVALFGLLFSMCLIGCAGYVYNPDNRLQSDSDAHAQELGEENYQYFKKLDEHMNGE